MRALNLTTERIELDISTTKYSKSQSQCLWRRDGIFNIDCLFYNKEMKDIEKITNQCLVTNPVEVFSVHYHVKWLRSSTTGSLLSLCCGVVYSQCTSRVPADCTPYGLFSYHMAVEVGV